MMSDQESAAQDAGDAVQEDAPTDVPVSDGLSTETETKKRARARKSGSEDDPVWLEWVGESYQTTPPLPSADLTEAWVRYYLSSMDEVDGLVKTGVWKSHIPDGALPKTVKKPTGG